MSIPISNASDTLLNQTSGTLPYVGDTMFDYFQPMTFVQVIKTNVNYQTVETAVDTDFQGVWQPLTEQQLMMKEEGQRKWSWFMVHADPSLNLVPDDVITYLGVQYRVMAKKDYRIYGYNYFELIDNYLGAGPG